MEPTEPLAARMIDVTGLPDTAVEAVQALVDVLRGQATPPPGPPSGQTWATQFDAWMHEVALRARRYPEGFVVDDSRETIYESRGE